jgi:hypothetical protein
MGLVRHVGFLTNKACASLRPFTETAPATGCLTGAFGHMPV